MSKDDRVELTGKADDYLRGVVPRWPRVTPTGKVKTPEGIRNAARRAATERMNRVAPPPHNREG